MGNRLIKHFTRICKLKNSIIKKNNELIDKVNKEEKDGKVKIETRNNENDNQTLKQTLDKIENYIQILEINRIRTARYAKFSTILLIAVAFFALLYLYTQNVEKFNIAMDIDVGYVKFSLINNSPKLIDFTFNNCNLDIDSIKSISGQNNLLNANQIRDNGYNQFSYSRSNSAGANTITLASQERADNIGVTIYSPASNYNILKMIIKHSEIIPYKIKSNEDLIINNQKYNMREVNINFKEEFTIHVSDNKEFTMSSNNTIPISNIEFSQFFTSSVISGTIYLEDQNNREIILNSKDKVLLSIFRDDHSTSAGEIKRLVVDNDRINVFFEGEVEQLSVSEPDGLNRYSYSELESFIDNNKQNIFWVSFLYIIACLFSVINWIRGRQ